MFQQWFQKVSLEGRLYDLNRAVARLTFWPDLNFNSEQNGGRWAEIKLTLSSTLYSNLPSSQVRIFAIVKEVNDAPVLSVDKEIRSNKFLTGDMLSGARLVVPTLYTYEDSQLSLSRFVLRDVDLVQESIVRVNMTALRGKIRFPTLNATAGFIAEHGEKGVVFIKGSWNGGESSIGVARGGELVFLAPLRVVNDLLGGGMIYEPSADYFGTSGVYITVHDLGERGVMWREYVNATSFGLSDLIYQPIVVQPVNDPPLVVLPQDQGLEGVIVMNEGEWVHMKGAVLNPLNGGDVQKLVNLTFTAGGFEGYLFRGLFGGQGSVPGGILDWGNKEHSTIHSGGGDSSPRFFAQYKNMMYYQATGDDGAELYRDGGFFPPLPFVDLLPGSAGSHPAYLSVHQNILYFAADGYDETWRLPEIYHDGCGGFRRADFDPRVFFAVAADNEWEKDRHYDCPQGFHWASTDEGLQLFTNTINGNADRFWHSQASGESGQRHGSQFYTDVDIGQFEQSTSVERSPDDVVTNPTLSHQELPVYYSRCGWQGSDWGGKRRVHFRFSDSSTTGAYKHAGLAESYQLLYDDAGTSNFAGVVCIADDSLPPTRAPQLRHVSPAGRELWKTDGTIEGTSRVTDLFPGQISSDPAYIVSNGDVLFFVATGPSEGREVYRLTPDGEVAILSDFDKPGVGLFPGPVSADPSDLIFAEGLLIFSAVSPLQGRELVLWGGPNTGGVDFGGKFTVVDIVAGASSSSPHGFCSADGKFPVLFAAYTEPLGVELYKTDGSVAGTELVRDISLGASSSDPGCITYFKGRWYFYADDSTYGIELWVSDGTLAGTNLFKDIRTGSASSYPAYFTPFIPNNAQEFLYFAASDGLYGDGVWIESRGGEASGGTQLWVTDGTEGGTLRALQRSDNDFYLDRNALDADFPSQFGAFSNEGALYIPAKVGGGPRGELRFDPLSFPSYDVSQLAIVGDIDGVREGTSSSGTQINVTLSANKGGSIIITPYPLIPPIVTTRLRVLVAEARDPDRVRLANLLIKAGYSVDAVKGGEEAYNAVRDAYHQGQPFDAALLALSYPSYPSATPASSLIWDGYQALRMIRAWEEQETSRDVLYSKLVIFALDKGGDYLPPIYPLPGQPPQLSEETIPMRALKGGANYFVPQPPTDIYPAQGEGAVEVPPPFDFTADSPPLSQHLLAKHEEVWGYADVVSVFSSTLVRPPTPKVTTTVIVSNPLLKLSPSEYSQLPGGGLGLMGNTIEIVGDVWEVNNVLRGVFFFAPLNQGTRNDVKLTINVREVLSDNSSSSGVEMSTQRELGIWVVAVNSPPRIFTLADPPGAFPLPILYVSLDTPLFLPVMSIQDIDYDEEGITLISARGEVVYPPIYLRITAVGGRVFLPSLDRNVQVLAGGGRSGDRSISLQGPFDKVKESLEGGVRYQCHKEDGCMPYFNDSISLYISDLGFHGSGGPLSHELTLYVSVN